MTQEMHYQQRHSIQAVLKRMTNFVHAHLLSKGVGSTGFDHCGNDGSALGVFICNSVVARSYCRKSLAQSAQHQPLMGPDGELFPSPVREEGGYQYLPIYAVFRKN